MNKSSTGLSGVNINVFDPARSALITIDVQTDFATRGGVAYTRGSASIVETVGVLVDRFRTSVRPIVHTVRLFHEDAGDMYGPFGSVVERVGNLVTPGTTGCELIPRVRPEHRTRLNIETLFGRRLQELASDEWALLKPGLGAFFDTRLRVHLERLGIESLVVAGIGFPHGVRPTIVEAIDRGFGVIMPCNAVTGVYRRGISECAEMGALIVDSAEVCDWMGR